MFYDPEKNDHGLPYNPFKALAVPRPIGWISTVGRNGVGNLSPYSFFNALSYNPPFVMFSAGCRDDGSLKDSVRNAQETGEFVFNMATWDLREKMSDTSWIMERDIDEMLSVGLTPAPSLRVKPARVAESPVHFECLYHQTVVLPGYDAESVHHVVFGKVIGVHIRDEYINEKGLVDVLKLKPIARLGYKDYTAVESAFSMPKRTVEEKLTRHPATQAAE
jgi:flavin reductase (DIM6/NTAB) family NADH-FMN oxidoreductase RutF